MTLASLIELPGHFVNGSPVTDVSELLFNDGSCITMAQINQLLTPAPAGGKHCRCHSP